MKRFSICASIAVISLSISCKSTRGHKQAPSNEIDVESAADIEFMKINSVYPNGGFRAHFELEKDGVGIRVNDYSDPTWTPDEIGRGGQLTISVSTSSSKKTCLQPKSHCDV